MSTMHRNRGWKLLVFGREHGIPHYHLWTPDQAAAIAIETSAVLAGQMNADVLAEARFWANSHRAELLAEWYRLNPETKR